MILNASQWPWWWVVRELYECSWDAIRFKEAFEQENGYEVFLRAGHDAKKRKKTDRRMEFVFVATRCNSHEQLTLMFDPRQVRQGVEFRSSSGASWMAGRVRTRIC